MTKINKEGWEIKKLGEVCVTSSGGTPSKSHPEYFEGGTIPWLRSGEVSQGNIYETELCITEEGMNNSSAKMFPQNTVVVAMYGATVGEVGILRNPMTTNQAVCGIFPTEFHLPEFLYYVLAHKKNDFIKQAAGGAQPNISQAVVRNTNIPLPPLPIQRHIVEELDEINAIISAKKQQLQKLDELAQSIFYTMFGDPVANEKGWEVRNITNVCVSIQAGGDASKHDIKKAKDDEFYIPVFSNGVDNQGLYGYSNHATIEQPAITLAARGTIGAAFIRREPYIPIIRLVSVIPDLSLLSLEYLFFILQQTKWDNTGCSIPQLPVPKVKSLNIPLPPLPLQETFAARVSAIEDQKAAIAASIEKMQTLLDARMQEYFG